MTSEKLTAGAHTALRIPLFVASSSAIRKLLPHSEGRAKQTVYVNTATSEQRVQFPMWDYYGPGPDAFAEATQQWTQSRGPSVRFEASRTAA